MAAAAWQDGIPEEYKETLDISDERLEQEFMAMLAVSKEHAPDLEDKKKLMDALKKSMDRIQKTIEKRGFDMAYLPGQESSIRRQRTISGRWTMSWQGSH